MIVNRVTIEEYGISISKKPFNSRLDKSKLVDNGFKPLPDWKDALYKINYTLKHKVTNPKEFFDKNALMFYRSIN